MRPEKCSRQISVCERDWKLRKLEALDNGSEIVRQCGG